MTPSHNDTLDQELRKYCLNSLLTLIAESSKKLYRNGESCETVIWKRRLGGLLEEFKQLMPIWGLAELSYRAIINSNDHRSLDPKLDDLYKLNNFLAEATDKAVPRNTVDDARLPIFVGLPQTQLWWQEIVRNRASIVYDFLRYYLLLNEMPKHFPQLPQPNDDLLKITGFGIEDFSKLLFSSYAWLYSSATTDINLMKVDNEVTKSNPVITLDNMKKCLSFFSEDYAYFRESTHANNPLFFRPIIKTQSSQLIISNMFIWVKMLYEGIYWLIRDEYRKKGSTDFTSAFGQYYEKYVESFLHHYLKPADFQRINEPGKADWLIFTNKYVLIVEQKSALMSVALKKPYPEAEQFGEYLKIFNKARAQLFNTDASLKKDRKASIKLILHFETMYFKEAFIKAELVRMNGGDKNLLKHYFLVDTKEFEVLIQLLSEDPGKAEEIIRTKIDYEINPPPPAAGLDFFDVIEKKGRPKKISFLEKHRHIFDDLVKV